MNNVQTNILSLLKKKMIAFFSDTLSKETIKETIRTMKKKFIKRPGEHYITNKLQLLKKCEWELSRLSKNNPTAPDIKIGYE